MPSDPMHHADLLKLPSAQLPPSLVNHHLVARSVLRGAATCIVHVAVGINDLSFECCTVCFEIRLRTNANC
eukprot:6214197-Pleurochrysis_carterae.AAC.2